MSSPHMEKFGQKLRFLRKQRGLTLRELGEMLGAHYTHLNNIEHGSKRPSTDLVLKVAQLFDVSTDQLMKDDVELPWYCGWLPFEAWSVAPHPMSRVIKLQA